MKENTSDKKKKMVSLIKEIGFCYLPDNDEMHEYQLVNKNGDVLFESSCFESREKAILSAKKIFPGVDFEVIDLTEKWYIKLAEAYRTRIKNLHPSFKETNIILDMSKLYYSRTPNDWYTFIPFEYNGTQWNYRETASGEWIEKSARDKEVEKKITNSMATRKAR